MSMPMLAATPMEPADRPALRLADDVAAEAEAVAPSAGADASTSPRAFVQGGRLLADDAATLPGACVVCGDSVGLIALPTLRGRVRFSLCHEHVISAAARGVAGLAVLLVLGYLLAKGGGSRLSTLAMIAVLMPTAGALIASAVPIWTWHRKGSGRQLFRVGPAVRSAIERPSA